jgi:hypothetical protein
MVQGRHPKNVNKFFGRASVLASVPCSVQEYSFFFLYKLLSSIIVGLVDSQLLWCDSQQAESHVPAQNMLSEYYAFKKNEITTLFILFFLNEN